MRDALAGVAPQTADLDMGITQANINPRAPPGHRQHGHGGGGKTVGKLESGFVLSLRQQTIKDFPTSGSLRIVGIFDLDPGKRVRAGLGLADDSLQVLFARQLEETRPVTVQMVHVQQVRVVRWNEPVQPPLAIQKRRLRNSFEASVPLLDVMHVTAELGSDFLDLLARGRGQSRFTSHGSLCCRRRGRRNGSYTSPVTTQSRCSKTASLRATPTATLFFAFFPPRSHSRSPCRRKFVSGPNGPKMYCALPTSSLRIILSPALLMPNCSGYPLNPRAWV